MYLISYPFIIKYMYLIAQVFEKDFLWIDISPPPPMFTLRQAVRGICADKNGRILILHARTDGYYKLTGWGIEWDEDLISCLEREVLEETWITVDNIRPLGITIEYKHKSSNLQISTVFSAKTRGKIQDPIYTDQEIIDWLTFLWKTPREALELMRSAEPQTYIGKCIRLRDIRILEWWLAHEDPV